MTRLDTQNGGDGQTAIVKRGATFTPDEQKSITAIETVIQDCELMLAGAEGKIAKAFAMARGIGQLRAMITDKMMADHIMPLMNTRLGFKTDKDPNRKVKNRQTNEWSAPQPYSLAIVKECLIEAMLRGAYPVNNEFNIISGAPYLTKEYFERTVGQLPGVTDLVSSPGIPQNMNGKTVVRFGLSWKKNGIADMLRDATGVAGRVFEIKTDDYSSTDQILGKATRKAYAAAYKQITGSQITLPEGDADEAPPMAQPMPGPDAKERDADLKARAAAAKENLQNAAPKEPASPAPESQPGAEAAGDIPTSGPALRRRTRKALDDVDAQTNRIASELKASDEKDQSNAGASGDAAQESPTPSKMSGTAAEAHSEPTRVSDDAIEFCSGPWREFVNRLWAVASEVSPELSRLEFENGITKNARIWPKATDGTHSVPVDKRALIVEAVKAKRLNYKTGVIETAKEVV